MPTYPEQPTVTGSNFLQKPGTNIPISGYALEDLGWQKWSSFSWTKGENTILYDGAVWMLNGHKIQYINDIHC